VLRSRRAARCPCEERGGRASALLEAAARALRFPGSFLSASERLADDVERRTHPALAKWAAMPLPMTARSRRTTNRLMHGEAESFAFNPRARVSLLEPRGSSAGGTRRGRFLVVGGKLPAMAVFP